MIKLYNTQNTNLYINGLLVAGVVCSFTNVNYSQTYNLNDKTSYLQNSMQNIKQDNNEIVKLLQTSNQVMKNMKFDFLKVDENLDKEIDSYLASYTGKNIEILDL
ncbi:hypothetical protein RZR97_08090 [Hydrogenimonas thermophila]|uniref:hypothetical protein n=1 Tax=Hydrogenimonas thermophila TaxID=223786 RepID=UPI002937388F|nr:hypothetical protein [Hydrogenimonas thermophila]WOE69068.1 hypothetical protein RZR91_08115 [Hydrogenimonas thermophila]WOE71578.1 hypothetical protein RZR97_08090 [Hydrogenimonas thermophila]